MVDLAIYKKMNIDNQIHEIEHMSKVLELCYKAQDDVLLAELDEQIDRMEREFMSGLFHFKGELDV